MRCYPKRECASRFPNENGLFKRQRGQDIIETVIERNTAKVPVTMFPEAGTFLSCRIFAVLCSRFLRSIRLEN